MRRARAGERMKSFSRSTAAGRPVSGISHRQSEAATGPTLPPHTGKNGKKRPSFRGMCRTTKASKHAEVETGAAGGEAGAQEERARDDPTRTTRVAWKAADDAVLRRLITVHGTAWETIARTGLLGGRSARGLESRWALLKRTERAAGPVAASEDVEKGVAPPQAPQTPPYRWTVGGAAGRARCYGSAREAAEEEEAWLQGASGSGMEPMAFVESAEAVQSGSRRRSHGRPWTYALQEPGRHGRALAARERGLSEAWGLDETGETSAVVIAQAEQRAARGVSVAVRAGDVLPTLMGSRSRVPVLSGAAVGGRRLMTASEAACLLDVTAYGILTPKRW